MSVHRASVTLPVSDEMVVDFGLGTDEQIAEAAARLAYREQEMAARWQALPLRVRFMRRLRWRVAPYRERIALAYEALRGRHECDP